ncbi:HpcH/HpaI aldolase family protein [Pseudobacteriovorax antillogorgiicola]|uniref:2-dehydro-3-deoxyglucarate aldolase n=1 Tax=Pseudobacteriovorax antillogorgiicola TaxID=1513793 RepID=A0A1Y6CUD6_9BACT|nr:aldolase/citrate lyase family protein [Pseudobacteriovorax antillogorgiicola]TCS45211.1 2-dehydro-3-deoxyglucarate aldolase [Pseudobacteriovorax antillogorgiicola]SMF75484.1 2-dehydro-3-deoxyglucarate aldolase [Pseudobacteriovorax antillogorgiicola]
MTAINRNQRFGGWITCPHPMIADCISHLDSLEWICIDLEHSPVDRQELFDCVAVIQGNGKKAFARVNENQVSAMKFALDTGVDGLIVPMVNSRAEAEDAVSAAFYPPKGKRPVGLGRAHKYGFAFDDHLSKNRDLELIVQIEHIDAVRNIEEICSVEGLSGIFIGPYDLSGSMGIIGQLNHSDLLNAIQRVANTATNFNLDIGAHIIHLDSNKLNQHIEQGYNFLALSTDMILMRSKFEDFFLKGTGEIL